MDKQVLLQELYELEDEIKMFECFAKEEGCWENINAEAAKQDVKRLKYRYKVKTIDLTVEDRKELAQMAADQNIKLELLFESVFTEEEKEDYQKLQSFYENFESIYNIS